MTGLIAILPPPVYLTPTLRRFPLEFCNGAGGQKLELCSEDVKVWRYVHSLRHGTGNGQTDGRICRKISRCACAACWDAIITNAVVKRFRMMNRWFCFLSFLLPSPRLCDWRCLLLCEWAGQLKTLSMDLDDNSWVDGYAQARVRTIENKKGLWHCWFSDMEDSRPVKRWALVCWWWRCDWSFARLTALVVTTISIIISSNKIQNGDALVPANPRSTWKMTVQTEREFGNKNTDYAFPRRRLTLNTVYCARFYIDS